MQDVLSRQSNLAVNGGRNSMLNTGKYPWGEEEHPYAYASAALNRLYQLQKEVFEFFGRYCMQMSD